MAYKFQLGAATMSGSLTQEGDVTVEGGGLKLPNGGIIGNVAQDDLITLSSDGDFTFKDGAFDFDIASHDGTNGLKLGGTLVAATAAQINQLQSGAVTSVTSLLATDIKIGEDDQTKIDFEDANKINFYANNAKELVLEENKLTPGANDGIALGDASLGFSDIYLADGGIAYYGNDQDVQLSHVADSGLMLQATNAGASNGAMLKLQLSSSSPADNDEIGKLVFAGHDDAGNAEVFGQIVMKSTDVSNGSEDGSMQIAAIVNGSPINFIDINGTTASEVTFVDGAYNVDIASHDGTNGLKLGGTLVTATAAQINQLQSGAVTSVTSLLATDIKIGEDDQTKIDFEDANKINFYANNAKEMVLEENSLSPGTNDGTALGTTSLGWSDLYVANGGAIEFGNSQDFKLYWGAADNARLESAQDDFVFELKNTNAGANGETFRFHASSSSPADNDKIGGIEFMGYDDGGGAHIFGAIEVTATDVSAGAEQSKMELKVAEFDGTSTTGIKLAGGASNGIIDVQIGAGASSTTEIAGNLVVRGTTTTVHSTAVNITGSFVFEGSTADGNETTLGVIDPTGDRTLNLANVDGTLVPFAAASTTAISSTPEELNLLDGSAKSTSSITLDNADAFIVIDGTTTKQIPASDIKSYIGSTSNLDVALKDNTETLAVGVNYFADFGGSGETVNLPASPSVGDAVYVKAPSNCASNKALQVDTQGSHLIDGEDQIILESPHAAVMIVYVVANVWKVF